MKAGSQLLPNLGVQAGDKIIIYKSSKFDTYLLATAAAYLGAVPTMISYHFPASTIEVFFDRLEDPLYPFLDEETENRVAVVKNSSPNKQIAVRNIYCCNQLNLLAETELPHDQIFYMTHTSGTTGIPKLICHRPIPIWGGGQSGSELSSQKSQKQN